MCSGAKMPQSSVHVKRRSDGRYYVQQYLCTNHATGRPVRPYRSWPADMDPDKVEAEARAWWAQQLAAWGLGTAMYLEDALSCYVQWREDEGKTAENTIKAYRGIVRNRLKGLRRIDPRKVTALMLTNLYHELVTSGAEDGGRLDPNTVRQVHWFMRGAFDWMVEHGMVATNPAVSATVPKPLAHEAVSLDEDGLGKILDALAREVRERPEGARESRRHAHLFAAWLALHTGMRCGECCAVRRMDVRIRQGSVSVSGTVIDAGSGVKRQSATKGHRPRTVAVSAEDMATIREYMAWQDGLLGGSDRKRPLVSVDGSYCRPKDVSATFTAFAREMGLPAGVTFHSLRHTHGTWLLITGGNIRVVQERLGHADVATTLRIYAHVLPGLDLAAAQGFTDLEREMRA